MKLNKTTVTDELRDLQNWIAVFEQEYDLPTEVTKELRSRIERISQALQELAPQNNEVKMQSVKSQQTSKQVPDIYEEAHKKEESYWGELEDEDSWIGLDQELEDDEIDAEEAAFVKGYTAERKRAAEKG